LCISSKNWIRPRKQFLTADLKLDAAATGPRWLSDPEIAGYAEDAIIRGAELGHYALHAYVVIPNHVHILLDPRRRCAGLRAGSRESLREMQMERWAYGKGILAG